MSESGSAGRLFLLGGHSLMANFTTHIAVGTVVSGALATLTLAANVIGPESLIAVTMAGVLGSVLPDIDLKDSRPSRAMFSGLGIFFSFAVLFSCAGKYSIVELWVLWLGTLVGVRYGLHALFHRIAVHRGVWHSLLATVFVSLLTVLVFKYVLDRADGVAWLGAGFMAIGYLTHLVLDELYSVDVMDTRIKASFGTAIKFIDINNWHHSAAMAVMTVGLVLIAPSPTTFIEGMTSPTLWAGLKQKLLPQDAWFGLVDIQRGAIVAAPPIVAPAKTATAPAAPTAPLTTGSIPPASPFRTIATDTAPPAR
jgi:membrane-bound metal-dependent hydrolase YbcI (DUF457 family)